MKDPTRDEMLECLSQMCGGISDDVMMALYEIEVEEAIYWFANDYHGGQASNLYEVLSTSPYNPGPIATGPQDRDMYQALEAEFGK